MNASLHSQAMVVAFSLFLLCFFTCTLSGIVLFFIKEKKINAALQHPLLKQRAFKSYPFGIQASIFLDYFFRLMFPRTRFWLIGHANQLLAHIDPKRTSLDVKWPVIGFWGSCWLGLVAMIAIWTMLFLGAAA